MDTRTLRWFQQVADGITLTELSALEHVSQPGMSRALTRLEAEVGASLFHRSGRTLRMTHAGSVFKRHIDQVLHQLDDGLAAVSREVDPETGTVALAFQTSLGAWLVPDLLSSFRTHHPGVSFELTQAPDHLVDSLLDSRRADLVISTVPPASGAIAHRLLMNEPLMLAVPAGHDLAAHASAALSDAADEAFLVLRPTSFLRGVTDELCRQAGFRPRVAFEGDDVQTLRGFVAAGLGLAIIPASGERRQQSATGSIRYLPISDLHAERQIRIAWVGGSRPLPAVQQFRNHVIERGRAGLLPDST